MAGTNKVGLEYAEVLGQGSGVSQLALEYAEVLGNVSGGQSKLGLEYAEVIGHMSGGTNKVGFEYIEVIGSMLPAPPNVGLAIAPYAITASWQSVSTATAYQVWQGTTSGGETLVATITGTSYTASNLTPGTTYYFYVIAVTPAGNSQSAEVSAVAVSQSPIQQLSPLLEDGGCVVAYQGTPNCYVTWAASVGTISPLSQYTDATGIACAYYSPAVTGGVRLLEGAVAPPVRPSQRLLEGGAGRRLLEGTSGATTGTVVAITVTQYA
jgi:hypothetical protein